MAAFAPYSTKDSGRFSSKTSSRHFVAIQHNRVYHKHLRLPSDHELREATFGEFKYSYDDRVAAPRHSRSEPTNTSPIQRASFVRSSCHPVRVTDSKRRHGLTCPAPSQNPNHHLGTTQDLRFPCHKHPCRHRHRHTPTRTRHAISHHIMSSHVKKCHIYYHDPEIPQSGVLG